MEVAYRRLSGRSGPGAGRPAKLYRRSTRQFELSLPPRCYQLMGELLTQAMELAGGTARRAGHAAATAFGEALGRQGRGRARARNAGRTKLAALEALVDDYGYEPRLEGSDLVLGNCPFHVLAQGHKGLICSMNLALFEGLLKGLGANSLRARSEMERGRCCVAVSAPRRSSFEAP